MGLLFALSSYVAFLGKHNITLANGRNLELLHSLHENVRVKSGVSRGYSDGH